MLNYKDDQCNYVGFLFHEALKEYLKDDGEADKLIKGWRDYNKHPQFKDFPKIRKEEVELIKHLKAFEPARNGELPMVAIFPILAKCPNMTTDLLCLIQDKCGYLINVKTFELVKKDSK